MRHAFILAFLIFSLIPASSHAGIDTISSAINKAGRQRMISQRIVATYCQIGQSILTKKSRKQLRSAISLFEEQLAELKDYRSSGEINTQLQCVSKVWKPLKAIVTAPIVRSNARELRMLAEDVLKESHRVVIMLQDESGTKKSELINISGRQRMLSQRLANLYMLQSWGFTSSEYSGDYSIALNEFKGALGKLIASSQNTEEIKNKLIKAKREFHMFERSSHQETGKYIPLMVKLSADKLLLLMNNVTYLYEQLIRKD